MRITGLLAACLLAAAILSLSACGGGEPDYPTMNIDLVAGENGEYDRIYDGEAQEFLNIADTEADVIRVNIHRVSGYLSLKIYEVADESNVIYEGHDFPGESFTVKAEKPGYYRIFIHAEDFVGDYDFDYRLG